MPQRCERLPGVYRSHMRPLLRVVAAIAALSFLVPGGALAQSSSTPPADIVVEAVTEPA